MCIIVPKNKGIYSKRNEEELKIFGLRTTVYKYCTDKRDNQLVLGIDKQSKFPRKWTFVMHSEQPPVKILQQNIVILLLAFPLACYSVILRNIVCYYETCFINILCLKKKIIVGCFSNYDRKHNIFVTLYMCLDLSLLFWKTFATPGCLTSQAMFCLCVSIVGQPLFI